jgi:hypothetical protein
VDQLKAENQVTAYLYMAGSGSMDTYEGTWTSGDKLTITLRLGEQNFDLEFTCELKDNNNLILTRFSPDNTIKVINPFRRK